MIGRRVTVGLALLCALVFSAFAATGAQAIKGTTAFTCVDVGAGGAFNDPHCKEAGGSGKYTHIEIAQDKTTKIHVTNNKTKNKTLEHTPAVLEGTIAGVAVKITCTKVFGHGSQINKINEKKEHFIHGGQITLLYSECEINIAKCEVENKKIMAEGITATTEEQGDNIRFKPEVGTTFVSISVVNKGAEKCAIAGKFPVSGSVRGQADGATINFNHKTITEEKTLTFGVAAAGLSGSVTVSQVEKTEETAPTGNPISVTTVET